MTSAEADVFCFPSLRIPAGEQSNLRLQIIEMHAKSFNLMPAVEIRDNTHSVTDQCVIATRKHAIFLKPRSNPSRMMRCNK